VRLRYYLIIMARQQTTPPIEPLKVYSAKLTPTAEQVLQRLSQDASDALGWTVTSSAMLRALIAYAGKQPASWASSALHPLVEQEIAGGRVWGSKKRG
jgi:hypothetical protein